MARAFQLPDLGEGIHEGEVLSVRVAIGDKVKEGDIILEVETDKAAVEIPSPYSGVVEQILVKPGDTVKVGQVMLRSSRPWPVSGAGPSSRAGLCRRPEAAAFLLDEANRMTPGLASYERVKKIAVLDRDFDIGLGEVTPTLKVRRNIVEQKYAAVIESLYAE